MSLVPYLVTALSRNDIPETPNNRNVVIGAIIEFKQGGVPQTIYDDAGGSNPATQKVTDSNGQFNAWVEAGAYELSVNGIEKTVILNDDLTAQEIGTLYESLPNTNKFTDAEKAQLASQGTAATKDVTTSSTDTTAGRLLKVGDFGSGATTGTPVLTDLDDFDTPIGVYAATSGTAGVRPTGGTSFAHISIERQASTGITQIYTNGTNLTQRKFFRTATSGAWSSWYEIYHDGNLNTSEFGGVGSSRRLGTGYAASSTSSRVFLPISLHVSPSSISTSGTFQLLKTDNSVAGTNLTPTLDAFSSNKLVVLSFTGLSGLTPGETLVLAQEGTAKIMVNS